MTTPSLEIIRNCFEGVVPAVLATCDGDGVPNVSMISQVHYVDSERVALSYQFFNKTRRNLLATRAASVSVFDPVGLKDYRLELAFEETQTEGPLFQIMKAKLAGIASHTGMEGVFHLRGSDIFRVLSVAPIPGPRGASPPSEPRNLLAAVRRSSADLASASELGEIFDRTLACLKRDFGIAQAMILMLDREAGRLFTIASIGYERSGIGSELLIGHGVVGVAAREGVPIRIGHMTAEYSYGAAVRDQARDHDLAGLETTEIPYPGLTAPESQIALPIEARGRTLGVLFAESTEPLRFRYDDEDALALLAERLGALIEAMPQKEMAVPLPLPSLLAPPARAITIRHYAADDSVFLDHEYLIKGVAGAILWKLLRENAVAGRSEFTNRELRLDPTLRLPEYTENLEARLVLLQRRLRDRECPIQIEKSGRGRFSLCVPSGLALEEIGSRGASRSV